MSGRGNVNVKVTSDYDNSGAARAQRDMDRINKQQARAAAAAARDAAQRRAAINTVATSLGLLGIAMTAAAAGAVAMSARFDYAMSAVKATGVSSLGSLREAALQAGRDTAYSAIEAAGAIEQLAKAGVAADDILSGGLTATLDLAAAGELEVARAAEITAVTLKQFGLAGEDAAKVADALASGAAKAVGGVEDLAQGLEYVGPVANSLGVTMEETVGTLAMFAEQGILGQKAGTGLRGVIMSLSAPTAAAQQAMEKYGISVYDTAGQFVGLEGLAGQLNEKLGGLDDATRQAALGQMFGNAQITAANILYQEGADSVAEWTDAVSESGYAAEVASTRLDNLQGDLQILRGSIETAMISLGESAQGPLRGMTQSLTGIVNAFAEMPPAAQGALLALVGGGGLLTLGAAGAMKLTTALAEAKIALQTLGWTAKGISIASGVGVALLALGAAYASVAGRQQEARQATEEYTGTLEDQTGAITDNTRAMVAKRLEDKGVLESAERIGVSLSDLVSAILGEGDAYETVTGQLEGYRVSMDQSADARERERGAVHDVWSALEGETGAVQDAIEAKRRMAEGSEASVAASEEERSAAEALTEALDDLYETTRELAELSMSRAEAEAAWAEQVVENRSLMEELNAVTDQTSASTIAATNAIDEATGGLDLYTEAGRLANESLLDTAKAGLANVDAARENGAATDELRAKTQAARDEFVRQAIQIGLTEDAANALADQYGLIPANVHTDVTANTDQALSAIQALWNAYDGKAITVYINAIATGAASGGARMLFQADGGIVEQFAGGGFSESHRAQIAPAGAWRLWAEDETGGESYIPLAPSKRADSIPIWWETGRRLGVVQAYADGGINGGGARITAGNGDLAREVARAMDGMTIRLGSVGVLADTVSARIQTQRRRY